MSQITSADEPILSTSKKLTTRYKDFYDKQRPAIDELIQFLESHHYKSNSKPTPEISWLGMISAYFILYFHKKIGPLIYFETSNDFGDDFKSQMKKTMDVIVPDPFVYSTQSLRLLSCQFEIESPLARGGKEFLQITIALTRADESGIDFIKHVVKDAIEKVKRMKDAYKIFYIDEKNDDKSLLTGDDDPLRLKDAFLGEFRVLDRYIKVKAA